MAGGTIMLDTVIYKLDVNHAFNQVLVHNHDNTIIITDLQGEILAEHTRPAPASTTSETADPQEPGPKNPQPSPKS